MPQYLSLVEVGMLFCAGYACGLSVSIGPCIKMTIDQATTHSARLFWKAVALFTSVVCALGVGIVFIFFSFLQNDDRTVQRVVVFGVALVTGMGLAMYLPYRKPPRPGKDSISAIE
jgi:energy-converting hydrogenase Eha subunit A